MFDIGGWEFLLIAIIAIIVIGPKDLPATMRTVTMWVRKARGLARDFRSGLDEIAREAELDDVKRQIKEGFDDDGLENSIHDIGREIEDALDPDDDLGEDFDEAGSPARDPLAIDRQSTAGETGAALVKDGDEPSGGSADGGAADKPASKKAAADAGGGNGR